MNRWLAEQWVEELESETHVKGQHYLKDPENERCCLGVLAGMCGIMEDDDEGFGEVGGLDIEGAFRDSRQTLPRSVLRQLGMTDDEQTILTEVNDNELEWAPVVRMIKQLYLPDLLPVE